MAKKLKEMNKLQKDLFMMLPIGMDKLLSTAEIKRNLGIDRRSTMELIEQLIFEFNIPIGSMREHTKHGYFIATNKEEKTIGTIAIKQQADTMLLREEKVKTADIETAYYYKRLYQNKEINHDEVFYEQNNQQLDLLTILEFRKKKSEVY